MSAIIRSVFATLVMLGLTISLARHGRHSPPRFLLRHLRELRDAARRVRQLVNKRIAHLDQKNVRRKPVTFQDIHDVIGLLDRTVVEYKLLLNAVSPQPSILPTWNYDWWEVFYDPWIKSPPPGWRRRSLG